MSKPDVPSVGPEHSIYTPTEKIEMVPQEKLLPYEAGRIALWRTAAVYNHYLDELPIDLQHLGLSVVHRGEGQRLYNKSPHGRDTLTTNLQNVVTELSFNPIKGQSPTDYRLWGKVADVKILGQRKPSREGVRRVGLLLADGILPWALRHERRSLIDAFDVPSARHKQPIPHHITVFSTRNHQSAMEFARRVDDALSAQPVTTVKLGKLNIDFTRMPANPPVPEAGQDYVYRP